MDLKQIHELIKIVNKSNIGEISIEDKDGKVTIKQKEEQVLTVAAPQQVYNVAPQQPQVASTPTAITETVKAETTSAPVQSNTMVAGGVGLAEYFRQAISSI